MAKEGELGESNEIRLAVEVVNPGTGISEEIDAIVDTGGRYSLISEEVAQRLELPVKGVRDDLVSFAGKAEEGHPEFYPLLTIEGVCDERRVYVVGTSIMNDGMHLGRTLLRSWDLDYRGPDGVWRIGVPG